MVPTKIINPALSSDLNCLLYGVATCHHQLREAPLKKNAVSIWALPVWGGGGLDPCHDVLGHLFREELSKFKWAFA